MNKIQILGALLLAGTTLTGCSFNARSAEDYASETKGLLKSKKADIKACYDKVIADKPEAGGTLVVNFTVEAKTGAIVNPTIDEEKSTGKNLKALGKCLLPAFEGLALDPPDARTGEASFEYTFKQNEPKQG